MCIFLLVYKLNPYHVGLNHYDILDVNGKHLIREFTIFFLKVSF